MGLPQGFWSYVHADDEAESGRIVQLAHDVVAQFRMLTGDIDLFLDRDRLEWGDDWRPKVDSSLASVAFFIPVITPRYFKSPECRRELNFFARQAERLGIKELVMPILYVDVPGLTDDPPEDELMTLIKRFQWEPWTELRFASRDDPSYRRAVAKMASRLAAANALAERTDATDIAISVVEDVEEAGGPGLLDRMARAETAMPEWTQTITSIGEEIERIGQLMQQATSEMQHGNSQGKGLASRLTVLRRVARELSEPADNIKSFGHEFTSQLHDVDEGIQVMIRLAADESQAEPESIAQICEFFASVRQMVESSEAGLGSLQGMIDAIAPIENMSRDLRAPLRKLRDGLTLMTEGREVMHGWVRQIEESPIQCDNTEPSSVEIAT